MTFLLWCLLCQKKMAVVKKGKVKGDEMIFFLLLLVILPVACPESLTH